jgi:hypothetical protein
MARPLRIEYAGAYYHVMNRGNRRQAVFTEPRDYELFLERLGQFSGQFEVRVLCYCCMPNHFHLSIEGHTYTFHRRVSTVTLAHLSLGHRTFTPKERDISASPHRSGPRRAATLIYRTFIRGVSLGTIMPHTGGARKSKVICDKCQDGGRRGCPSAECGVRSAEWGRRINGFPIDAARQQQPR